MAFLKGVMQFVGWEMINSLALTLKKNRRYTIGSLKGINLGCGVDNPKDYLGIDGGLMIMLRSFPSIVNKVLFRYFNMAEHYTFDQYFSKMRSSRVIHHELKHGIPLDDDSVSAVFSSHFVEHLAKTQAIKLMRECYRALRPEGIIRICVPSLEVEVEEMQRAIEHYRVGDVEQIQKYVTWESVGFNNEYANHRHMYDFGEMERLLTSVGFIGVSRKAYKVGDIPGVEVLDTREGLFVEDRKPHHSS